MNIYYPTDESVTSDPQIKQYWADFQTQLPNRDYGLPPLSKVALIKQLTHSIFWVTGNHVSSPVPATLCPLMIPIISLSSSFAHSSNLRSTLPYLLSLFEALVTHFFDPFLLLFFLQSILSCSSQTFVGDVQEYLVSPDGCPAALPKEPKWGVCATKQQGTLALALICLTSPPKVSEVRQGRTTPSFDYFRRIMTMTMSTLIHGQSCFSHLPYSFLVVI